jgi:DnaJ-domain-containing protein 1
MTTKEYVTKYKLDLSDRFSHSDFVHDLASDFIALLEMNKASDNIKGFDNALRCIRMKFDAISNKTLGVLPEKLWNYFYATVVVKLKEELCPKDVEIRKQQQEQKRKEWEARKERREWEQRQFNNMFEDFYSDFFNSLFSDSKRAIPKSQFIILGLTEKASADEVRSAYRSLTMLHHPDKGGKQDKFIEITNAKNECLSWLNSK